MAPATVTPPELPYSHPPPAPPSNRSATDLEGHMGQGQVGHEQVSEAESEADLPQGGQDVGLGAHAMQSVLVVLDGQVQAADAEILVTEVLPPVDGDEEEREWDLPGHVRQGVGVLPR